jgi:hypothetical protein
MISKIFLTLFLLNTAVLLLVSVLWRNRDTTFVDFLMAGTFIYRDLPKYIRKERTKLYLTLSYSFIAVFVLFITSMILAGPP